MPKNARRSGTGRARQPLPNECLLLPGKNLVFTVHFDQLPVAVDFLAPGLLVGKTADDRLALLAQRANGSELARVPTGRCVDARCRFRSCGQQSTQGGDVDVKTSGGPCATEDFAHMIVASTGGQGAPVARRESREPQACVVAEAVQFAEIEVEPGLWVAPSDGLGQAFHLLQSLHDRRRRLGQHLSRLAQTFTAARKAGEMLENAGKFSVAH